MRRVLYSFLAALFLLTALSGEAASQANRSEGKKEIIFGDHPSQYLDGVKYVYVGDNMNLRLTEDFLRVAFSRVPFLYQEDAAIGYIMQAFDPEFRADKWYWKNVFDDDKYPNLNGLMRWEKGSTIDVVVSGDPKNPQSRQKLLSAVQAILPEVAKKSGMKLKIVERDTTGDLLGAIVISDPVYTRLINKYKVFKSFDSRFNFIFPWMNIAFTMHARAQPTGHIFPKHDNTINYAICYVLSGLSEDMVQALTTECLLRSLGLPELTTSHPLKPIRAFLTDWNKSEAEKSYTVYLDGRRKAENHFEHLAKEFGGFGSDMGTEVVPDYIKTYITEKRISDFDSRMLQILYCPLLKPGMDHIEVMRILHEESACFEDSQLDKKTKNKKTKKTVIEP